jgi:hypothetical protein
MKSLLLVLLTATILAGPCHAQTAVGDPKIPTIKVLVINGKTGKPITDEAPNILFEGFRYQDNPQTNKSGEVLLNVHSSELRVLPNYYADCRLKGDSSAAYNVKYSVAEIMKTGIVSENVCGKHRVNPIPGVLVLYARQRTFFERMRL